MLNTLDQNPSPFQRKVRVRVCGILKNEDGILLIKHEGIGPLGYLWSPPGGGVNFGEGLSASLKREFLEETNLNIEVGEHLFTNEHIDEQHHAIELFFKVYHRSGNLKLGIDPEVSDIDQIISEARFLGKEELNRLPKNALHSSFYLVKSPDRIDDLRGLITFKD